MRNNKQIFLLKLLQSRQNAVIFLIVFCSANLLFGQQNLTFQSIQQGLSNKYIRCILKDSYGFMWFGTYNGLTRYDGTNIYNYEHDPANKYSICHNLINGIVEDENKNVWIATAEGLNLYNRELNNFVNIDSVSGNSNHLNNKFINTIFCAGDSLIWLGTMGHGINIYHTKNKQFEYIKADKSFSKKNGQDYITCFFEFENKLWIGTREGLYYADINNDHLISRKLQPVNDEMVGKKYIISLSKDNYGHLLASVQNIGLYCLEKKYGSYSVFPFPLSKQIVGINSVLTTFCDKNNTLWIGTENFGLTRISDNNIMQYTYSEGNDKSISSNSIWSIFVDNTEKVWIGTFNKGICLLDKHFDKFEIYQRNILADKTLADNDVTSFATDNTGNLWIATDGGGISVFNLKSKKFIGTINTESFPLGISNNAVKTLWRDSKNNLWAGTWSGGVDKIDFNKNIIKNYKLAINNVGDNMLQCLYEDKFSNIWAGTSGSGIFLYNKSNDRFVKPEYVNGSPSIPDYAYISSIYESENKTIWVGTYYGLFALKRVEKNKYSCAVIFKDDQTIPVNSNRISTIFEDRNKNLWFGTIDNGLNCIDHEGKKIKYFQKKDGLSSNMVNGIIEDNEGNLWISSNLGITKYNPKSGTINNYLKKDGLVSNEFYAGSCFKTVSGELLFGSDNGFNLFNPSNITSNPDPPIMYLTGLRVNNKPVNANEKGSPLIKDISATRQIVLNYKQTSFTLEYAGIGFTRPNCNTYQYKLEGFDKEWNEAGNQTSVNYTNLNPGTYHFLVKGFNNDGFECKKPAELLIKIKPPVWKTWWAYSLYVISFSLILFFFIRIRIERIKMANSLQMEKIAREKEHELNLSKTEFFTNISHEFRTPLSLIIGPLESIISSQNINQNFKSRLHGVYKNASRLMQLVNELMDFRKIEENKLPLNVKYNDIVKFISEVASSFKDEAKRKNIKFIVHHTNKEIKGYFDESKIGKVLFNLLSNAFKYTSENGEIAIRIESFDNIRHVDYKTDHTTTPDNIKISIFDNGKGILEEDLPYIFNQFYQGKNTVKNGTGIGLSLAKSLIELHHGSIKVHSTPDKQTEFSFVIPLNKEAYGEEEIIEADSEIIYEVSPSSLIESEDINIAITENDNSENLVILIAEDNDELRQYLTSELTSDYLIISARDGQEAFELALKNVPDLILTDIMMPNIDGIEFCRKLKNEVATSHIPIIMITAKTSVDNMIEGVEGGADVYVTKPFSIRFLRTQIKQLITNRQNLYSIFSREVHIIPGQFARNKLDEEFLEKIIGFISDNITNSRIGVETISDHLNLSRGQVYKKIKAITGQTAVEFIRNIRLKHAIKLMESRKYSLAEIAYQAGFTSPSYFTRSFKEQYGKAPSEYLKG